MAQGLQLVAVRQQWRALLWLLLLLLLLVQRLSLAGLLHTCRRGWPCLLLLLRVRTWLLWLPLLLLLLVLSWLL